MNTKQMMATLLLGFSVNLTIFAQEEADVNATYTMVMEENMTLGDAKRKVVESAKSEALKKTFGTRMTNTVVIQNTEVDGKSMSNFVERTIEESNGDWLGDTQPAEIKVEYDGNNIIFTAEVWGRAREIKQAKADIDWKILNRPNKDSQTDTFNNGDNIYISFKSPESGYLAIYLLDTKNAFCLLPYKQMTQGVYKIEAGKQYILFDPESDKNCVNPYKMTSNMSVETNEVVLIFSPHSFVKANDNKGGINKVNTLSTVDFESWQLKCRQQDREMFVGNKLIKIINNI